MTFPANLTIEASPYGPMPVLLVVGAQGGPYNAVDATHGIPVTLVGGAGATTVQGDTASGVADAGNPLKVGGKASGTIPAATASGNRVDAWYGTEGQQVTCAVTANSLADASTNPPRATRDPAGSLAYPAVQPMLFNGVTRDFHRNNSESTLLASAARTATIQSADQVNYNGKRLLLIVDVSLVGTGSITPSLQVKDPISGNYFTFWTAAAAIVTGATFAYLFEGGASGGLFTEKLAFGLPSRTWRLVVTHNNANAITYSASANVGV